MIDIRLVKLLQLQDFDIDFDIWTGSWVMLRYTAYDSRALAFVATFVANRVDMIQENKMLNSESMSHQRRIL